MATLRETIQPHRHLPGESLLRWTKVGLFALCGGNLRFYLQMRGHLMRRLGSLGFYERKCVHFLQQIIRPGDTVLDIGANLGVYTTILSRIVGKDGTVWAFEPQSDVYHELTRATRNNPQVRVFQLALSDRSRMVQITVPKICGLLPEPALASVESSVEVMMPSEANCVPLDSMTMELERLSFIKVDIEGHEIAFLEGARQTIARFRPWIQLEWLDRNRPANFLSTWLDQHNYEAGYVDSQSHFKCWDTLQQLPASILNIYLFPSETQRPG